LTNDKLWNVEYSGIKIKKTSADTVLYTDPETGNKHLVFFDTIAGYRTKFVKPKISGKGISGIYIDSLWKAGSDNDRFNLVGINLKATNERAFFTAVKTLRFIRN
jgi:hypothetical protein